MFSTETCFEGSTVDYEDEYYKEGNKILNKAKRSKLNNNWKLIRVKL